MISVMPVATSAHDVVACIGDWVAQGSGKQTPYPQAMQKLLSNYSNLEVRTYAYDGATAMDHSETTSFKKSKMFTEVLQSNAKFVFIMLGSNDATDEHWNQEKFVEDYAYIVRTVKEVYFRPVVYLCSPIPIYTAESQYGINPQTANAYLSISTRQVAREVGVSFVNTFAILGGQVEKGHTDFANSHEFLDAAAGNGYHPNDIGHLHLARMMASLVLGNYQCVLGAGDPGHFENFDLPIIDLYSKEPLPDSDIRGKNLIYIRGMRVGGTTVSSVMRHIAERGELDNMVSNEWIRQEPGVWASHNTLSTMLPRIEALKQPTFMVSWVRDPAERSLSSFYHFKVSHELVNASSTNMIEHLKETSNFNFNYINADKSVALNTTLAVEAAIGRFDFIGSADRFDESMLALAYTANLTFCDILYIRARDSNAGYADDEGVSGVGHQALSSEAIEVQNYVKSVHFRAANQLDYLLLERVHARLDAVIVAVGAARFKRSLHRYQHLLVQIQKECLRKPSSSSSSLENPMKYLQCYLQDEGCGHGCIDRVCYATMDCAIKRVSDY
jgi:lysophospholipase L1-like esterase